MSETLSPAFLPEGHKPELLVGTSSLSYGSPVASFPNDVGFTSSGAGRSAEAASFLSATTSDPSKQLDKMLAQSTSTQQLTLRMVSTNLPSNTEATTGAIATSDGLSPSAGNAAASLPFVNSSPGSDSKLLSDLEGGLPRLGFISSENAILTPSTRDQSTYNGVPKTDENGAEILQPTSSSETHPQSRAYAVYASSPSAAYDHSVYGDASSAGMNSWGVGGIGGTIGGSGLTLGEAADFAVRVWLGKGPEWVQQILGVPLSSKVMNDFADVIHGAVKKHGESPAESIQRQRYNIASSQHGEEVRNAIAYEFYHHNLTPAEHKALAVQLADGRKTLSQFRKEAAYSEPARQQVAEVFRQQHGFDPSQQDLDFASMKRGDGWSLQDYRQNEAHGERTANQLKDMITSVQGRPFYDTDTVWVRAQQDSLGNGQTNIQQIRQELARWTANHGGYDTVFQTVHDTAMQPSDKIYAADRMGDGWSVQEYRSKEAHSERAWREYGDLIQRMTNHAPNADLIRQMQDNIGNGSSLADERRRIAYSDVGRAATNEMYQNMLGVDPTPSQAAYYQGRLAQGASIYENRVALANGNEGRDAVDTLARNVFNRDLSTEERSQYQNQLANNRSIDDVRYDMAHSLEAKINIESLSYLIFGKPPTDIEVAAQQQMLGADVSWDALRKAQIYSVQACNYLASIHKDAFQTDITASDLARYQDDLVHHRDVYSEIVEFITPKAPYALQRNQWTYVKEDGTHGVALGGYVPKQNNFEKDPITGKTVNHPVPDIHSGVTIGHGIDLGQFLKSELKNIGVPDFLLNKLPDELFAPKSGSKGPLGQEAQNWLDKHELKLTRQEAELISAKVYEHHANITIGDYNNLFGDKSFNKLNSNVQTVIVDLGFRRGAKYLTSSPGENLANKIHSGDLSGASEIIKNFHLNDSRYTEDAKKLLEK